MREIEISQGTLDGEAVFIHHSVVGKPTDMSWYENWGYRRVTPQGPVTVLSKHHSVSTLTGTQYESWSRTTRSPMTPIPISLRVGESTLEEHVMTDVTFSTSAPTEKTKAYVMKYKYEFLGIEDVTLGNGTVVRNACKVRSGTIQNDYTPSFTGNTNVDWLAAGWGGAVRSEQYDKTGKLLSTETIVQVITAP